MAFEAGCAFATTDLPLVVDAAHRSGAVCLIAHPGRTDGFVTYDDVLLDQVRQEVPIDGLEVYYPSHPTEVQQRLLALARKYNLVVTGGSDYHGKNKNMSVMAGRGGPFRTSNALFLDFFMMTRRGPARIKINSKR